MTINFAWVDAGETTFGPEHEVEDEQVFRLRVAQEEGDFARAEVEVANPRVGLLGVGRQRWAWISYDGGGSDGAEALFFGRLLGLPSRLDDETLLLEFVARPADFDAQKAALADTLRVFPWWDPVWVAEGAREDPDEVLVARNALWHVDRVTHAVTISDFNTGEDGTIDLAGGFFHDSLRVAPLQPPARRIRVEAEVTWDQAGGGQVDLRASLLAAFAAAGSNVAHHITSYTGEGLESDWPNPGAVVGAGWRVRESELERGDGKWIDQIFQSVIASVNGLEFPIWSFIPTFTLDFEASRSRAEKIVFTLEADTQEMLTQAGEAEVLLLAVSSFEAGEPVDPLDSASFSVPIGDRRRNSFFLTDRGKQSLEHLIARARAQLLARARAVEIRVDTLWESALAITCRHNVRVADPRLPGGEATGKVAAYALTIDGDSGTIGAEVTIGATVGRGNSVSVVAGDPLYVADGYVEDGYQARENQIIVPIAGEVGYTSYDAQVPPNDGLADDGVDLLRMTPARSILTLQVFDGQAAQEAILAAQRFGSLAVAADALNDAFTEVDLSLVPLDTGPFEHEIQVTVTDLMVPKTIDLEAVEST